MNAIAGWRCDRYIFIHHTIREHFAQMDVAAFHAMDQDPRGSGSPATLDFSTIINLNFASALN